VDPHVDDSLQSRMIRAARLDPTLYDEVKIDPRALSQAMVVVLLSAVATGIAFGQGDLNTIVLGLGLAVAGWWVTAYLAFFIGTRILPERRADPGAEGDAGSGGEPPPEPHPAELLRAIGFASSPGIVRLLGAIPEFMAFTMLATTAWMICAAVIAIRQGLGFQSTARAFGVYASVQLMLVPLVVLLLSGQSDSSTPGP
jgi:hypothetical protein